MSYLWPSKSANSLKYLVVAINNHLKCNFHIIIVVKKKHYIMFINSIVTNINILSHKIIRIIFIVLEHSIYLYGIVNIRLTINMFLNTENIIQKGF